MIFPTIHLNGTGAETLKKEYAKAYQAIEEAMNALTSATLHARDYYVHPDPDAYRKALDLRVQQYKNLNAVAHYISEHLKHLHDCR